jgi:hypothetical protein
MQEPHLKVMKMYMQIINSTKEITDKLQQKKINQFYNQMTKEQIQSFLIVVQ